MQSSSALAFEVGAERLAVAASAVTEVVRQPRLVRPPLAPAALAGVVSLRGRVVPVVSMAKLLSQESASGAGESRVIVIEQDGPVGLLVDRVSAMVPCSEVGTPAQPGRMIDLPALLASGFARQSSSRAAAPTRRTPAAAEAAERLSEFLSFDVGGQEFALPLGSVSEVVALPSDVARVPHTDRVMRGVMALRGRLLPLVDLAVLLGFQGRPEQAQRVVVAELGGSRVGLVIDSPRAILRVPPAAIDPVPPVLTRGSQEAQVQSVCRLDQGRRLVSVLSTDHLLRDGLAERLREQVASEEEGGEGEEATVSETEELLVFTLGENSFGLPLACVEEVSRVPERLSRLPGAPAFVEGVMDLRGRVIPVIDQARRFNLAEAATAKRRVVVVRTGRGSAGFVVDSVSGIVRLSGSDLQDSPELAAEDNRTIHRIGMVEGGGMVLLIDPQELLDKAEQDMIADMHKDLSAPA
ncbi:chemotaxis protein CheW [Sphingomonas sp. LHG3406-1]|uniref:chemotaxis protein CheW n=1 Tax=Sphingomonas sp. LHG3406-1 TaxID=2804617 RepID=UPI0026131E99|nr:chemotaxis protein CheW [Sphingomonas sp. LHG3406-1]